MGARHALPHLETTMKKLLIAVAALCFALPAFAGKHSSTTKAETKAEGTGAKAEHEHVDAYTKKDGTVVKAHDRTTKDDTKDNNWSTKGNVNPETGKPGTK